MNALNVQKLTANHVVLKIVHFQNPELHSNQNLAILNIHIRLLKLPSFNDQSFGF
jgi:hypothetical protein